MTADRLTASPLTHEALSHEGITHGFFTRRGGVSEGIYESLNCGLGSDDRAENVTENRRRVAQKLGAEGAALLTPYQHHSADVAIVTAAEQDGWASGSAPKADAVVTAEPGVLIGILTADCAPVLFADPQQRVVGAAHSGWRGAVGGVLTSTLAAMEQLGAKRANIRAAVGPTISVKNYEVGPEFVAQFIAQDESYRKFFTDPQDGGRPHFDLPAFVVAQLQAAGIGEVAALDACTYENESLFYSYRRNCHQSIEDYGRHISAIGLN